MVDSLEIAKRLLIIKDNGPFYNEFIHESCVHEPWNAYSSLSFFIPICFWIWKLKGNYRKHLIIVILLPFLFLNGLGSTLFHAFRSSTFLHMLDWMPASAMSIVLTSYFWMQIIKKWYFAILLVMGCYTVSILTQLALFDVEEFRSIAPNIGYLFVGFTLFIPIYLLLRKNRFRQVKYILATVLFLILALLFRSLDYPTPNPFNWLPQGTHFLWHIFSSFAVFSLGFFIYKTNEDNAPII